MDTWKKKLKSKHEEERRYEGKNEGKWENDTCVQKTSNYHKNVIFDFLHLVTTSTIRDSHHQSAANPSAKH